MISVTNTSPYVYYYIFFPTTKAGEGCGLDCDSMQIAEITFYYQSDSTATSTATGSGSVSNPSDLCCGGVSTAFNANAGFTNRAGAFVNGVSSPDNKVIINQIGSDSIITAVQIGRKNYIEIGSTGSNNELDVRQTTGTNLSASNYAEITINGSNNVVNTLQNSTTGGAKGILLNVNNSNNVVGIEQRNNGNHYTEVNLAGGNKNVNVLQEGSAGHMAKIELTGGATAITTTQTGSTQQFYSITHNCASASCAAITVTQGQ
jgi:hypothetical protein